MRVSQSAASTRTAQNLKPGIFPYGSSASYVRTLAAASRKWKGMNTLPGRSPFEANAVSVIAPRLEVT